MQISGTRARRRMPDRATLASARDRVLAAASFATVAACLMGFPPFR